ncbi:MAG TPA: ATP-grasp domain-containing protein [Candidatus Woesebacteria bacterium]|nr:ATP-grasp domain-containing protein [Candidatus Woesebacteria bacterium]
MTSSLENLLNNSGFNFFFLVVDKFLDINLPQLKNFKSLSQNNLKIKNSGFLLSQKNIQAQIKKSQNPVIVPFKASAKIEHLCQKNQWLNASNPSQITRLLEDKIKFYQLCQKNNLPQIPAFIAPFTQNNFSKAQKLFGQKIVTQTHFGWAGNSTHLALNYSDINHQIADQTMTKFSPFKNGYSLLNNCCLTRHGLLQSPPALQYTGLKSLTRNPFATVGRQWPSLAPTEIINKINQITAEFSEKILKPLNYRGFFGLDFLISDNEIYLLECNPRLTASFAFYTQMELTNNLTPLFYFHLAEFIDLNYQIDLSTEQKRFYNQNLIGSEITLRNGQGTTIKKLTDFKIFSKNINPLVIDPRIIRKLKT